jgi:hypothetical protein
VVEGGMAAGAGLDLESLADEILAARAAAVEASIRD